MRVDDHAHVFTFKTFLTRAAEADLKVRLMAWHLSEAAANDAIKLAKAVLFGDAAEARLAVFAATWGLAGNPVLEFLRRGCLPDIDDVTDALMADTTAAAGEDDALAVLLMMDVVDGDSTPEELALYETQFTETVAQAERYPGRALPFVMINPLRGNAALDYLRRGLDEGRCVGVKLYPSLGYTVTDPMIPKILRACQDAAAPIIMHCNDAGFCGPGYDCTYCSPMAWQDVIADYDVRFDFAHFGDHTEGKAASDTHPSWRDFITTLMDRFPGRVYADVSYQSGPLGTPEEQEAYVAWLKGQLADETRGRHILFGTDSFLIFLATTARHYWDFFKTALGDDFGRIAVENPARFLGLPTAGTAPDPNTALGRHVAYLQERKNAPDSRFGQGAAPAGWLAGLL
ncbi:amidohydrolase family protein [Solidesulfovibrio sp. C21]|uniref:amidohydrolase family protein n=1 Tax=Solidesulfovibrio sp. C21 TaxID=3398613 RepID=UPI0039FDE089